MVFMYVIVLLTGIAIISTFTLRFIFPHRISNKEVCYSILTSFIISILSVLISLGNVYNYELWHGQVLSKYRDIVSCKHSNTVCTGSGEDRICITTYDHSYDYEWIVNTSIGKIEINTIDRQGSIEPPRFTAVKIGEPVSVEKMYIDYIRGSNSIFNTENLIDKNSIYFNKLPKYPEVYDYYKTNLVLNTHSVNNSIIKALNEGLREKLKILGNTKENSTIIVLTKEDQAFAEYLKSAWNNGKKNNGIVVIGFNDNNEITWVDVFGWSSNTMYKIALETDLLKLKTIDKTKEIVDNIAVNTNKYFERKPMSDFKYLILEREISIYAILLVILLQIFINAGLSYFNYKSIEVGKKQSNHFKSIQVSKKQSNNFKKRKSQF